MLFLLASPCLANGPKNTFQDPKMNDELLNVYHDIGNTLNMSTVTIRALSVSTITATSITTTSMTATAIVTQSLTATSISGVALGKIRQVVCGKTTSDFSTTQTTFQTSNLTVNITPGVATSSVVVVACGALTNNTSGQETDAALFRGNTNLCDSTFGCGATRVDATGMTLANVLSCFVTMDAPSAVVATGYQIKIKVSGGTGHFGNSATQNMCLFEVGV